MSYSLCDSTGPLTDFASIGGLSNFRKWALRERGPVLSFVQKGYAVNLKKLELALEDAKPTTSVKEQVELLKRFAPLAQDVLILSDGTSNLPDIRALAENSLHRAADEHLDRVKVAVQYAFARGRAVVNLPALRRATTQKDALLALDGVPDAVKEALHTVLPKALVACFISGAQTGLERITKLKSAEISLRSAKDPLHVRFDLTNPEAIAWAKEHVGELIGGISDTTRDEIIEAISEALDGDGIEAAFDDILQAIGDDARAEMIARTEVMSAVNEGQREAWSQAQEEGLLPQNAKKVWIASDSACDDCSSLDEVVVGLDEDYPEDGGDGPPLHPSCRCTEGISGD